jgi:hypothetical protein
MQKSQERNDWALLPAQQAILVLLFPPLDRGCLHSVARPLSICIRFSAPWLGTPQQRIIFIRCAARRIQLTANTLYSCD